METLVLPAQDQFASQQDRRNQGLVGVGFSYTNRHEGQKNNAFTPTTSLQTDASFPNGLDSLPGDVFPHETSCLFSHASPKPQSHLKAGLLASSATLPSLSSLPGFDEGLTRPPGRRWHSTPCSTSVAGENSGPFFETEDHGVGIVPDHSQVWPMKHENGRTARLDGKNRSTGHSGRKLDRDLNDKRKVFDWKPVEIGGQNDKSVPISARRRIPGRVCTDAISEISLKKEPFAFSPSTSIIENWAGPAYSNSPPPSSLPFPKFSMRQMRSVSLELPSASNQFTEAVTVNAALSGSSRSAPASPSKGSPLMLQDICMDVASATKDLRRMLNLDFNAT